ncbi:MAG: signal peptidase I [Proteobacteria bacterium]|nr:MAG: signal peptidase I [Pseudomonadota bacterium]
MESVETSQPDRLADLQLSVPRFLLYSLLTAGVYYIYRTILIFDRIARSKTERNIQRAMIAIFLIAHTATIVFMNTQYLENGYLLALGLQFGWYGLLVHGARRLQMDWGYRMDLRWTFLFGSIYFQYKANEAPAQDFRDLDKWALTYCTAIALIIYLYPSFQSYRVHSNAMAPSLLIGDHVRVDNFPSGELDQPVRGDIILFKDSKDKEQLLIGRVHGVPGETVRVVTYDGYDIEQKFLRHGEYYILGDNKEFGYDPKIFGIIHSNRFYGVAKRVIWSFTGHDIRWGRTRLKIKD